MTLPTAEEILAAWQSIDRDGPGSPTTIGLAALARFDPTLQGVLQRFSALGPGRLADLLQGKELAEAILCATLIYGLNLGIRIGEARKP